MSRARIRGGARYYLADFGLSLCLPLGQPRLAMGRMGADREVPKLSDTIPCDSFKADIFVLGNVFKKQIHDAGHRAVLPLLPSDADQLSRSTFACSSWGH